MRRRSLPLLALVLFVSSTAHAYEVKRTPSGAPIRWRVDRVSLELHRTVQPNMPASDGFASLALAANAWTGQGGPEVRMDPRMSMLDHRPGNAGVQVVWPDSWAHAPHLLAVTATSYVESTGEIVDADILINPDADVMFLEEGETGRFDLGAVVAHEAGHVLGLGESEVPDATMWPNIGRGERHQRELAADDLEGLAEAYRDAVMVPPTGCSRASVVSRTLHTGVFGIALLLLVAASLTGRRRLALGCVAFALVSAPTGGIEQRSTARAQFEASAPDAQFQALLRAGVTGVVRHAHTVRGRDGYLRTRLTVGTEDVTVPGGCLGGLCMEVGEGLPPRVGQTIAVDRASGAWAYRRTGQRVGGWMAPPPMQAR